MIIYCNNYSSHAGKWIYNGYRKAWKNLGYEVKDFNLIEQADGEYFVMTTDSDINEQNITKIKNSKKTFLFVQPNVFPSPWGTHPNFVSNLNDGLIKKLNCLENVFYWTFVDTNKQYYYKWEKPIYTFPLAFDSLNYLSKGYDSKYSYDVCFVGGWANNGFDEKRKIIINTFKPFINSGLKCGFFVNKNISHDLETEIIANSSVSLNIHDAYQRKLGLDTNERTFKSLALNGYLVSDTVEQLTNLFPNTPNSLNFEEIYDLVLKALQTDPALLKDIKQKNKNMILEKHTYLHRVAKMLELK